jgi:hypothetical protein
MRYNDSGFVKLYYIAFGRCSISQLNKNLVFNIFQLTTEKCPKTTLKPLIKTVPITKAVH